MFFRAASAVPSIGLAIGLATGLLATLAQSAPAYGQIPLIVPIPRKAPALPEGPRPPPDDLSPAEAEVWPFPAPDPQTWWTDKRPVPPEAADPLGDRRLRRGERLPEPVGGVDPSTYRLWGLKPLQWQVLRRDEAVLEVWARPSGDVRQAVVRVTVRGDGRAFVQGRAGLACCDALIGRRMGFDAALPEDAAARFRALTRQALWTSPRDVRVEEPGAADAVCLDGTAYDLVMAVPGRTVTLRRACDPAEVGEAADVLEAVMGAGLGHDGRFDAVFPRGADFSAARQAHARLLADGGRLKPNPDAPRPAPGREGAPEQEPEPPTPAPDRLTAAPSAAPSIPGP
ncbi:hypothetical protein [Phenylobacterium sp. SCN 70-31]|uniref:hypothetical protein n=1 Tax=Phenylobacterium sp. SCN 70-31 TaxID=1660129 RepID=UPI000A746406|nr:hypothetical protein [Phenylobacterium sp. SCN 70-31]